MQLNQSIFHLQPWSLYDYQFLDYTSNNRTVSCPVRSKWIHFEEYFFTSIGLLITLVITIKIHLAEIPFRDYHALFRYHTMNISLMALFIASFLFNIHSTESMCRYEQLLIQYSSTFLLTNVFLISFFRLMKYPSSKQFRSTLVLFLLNLILQTMITSIWFFLIKKKHLTYHHRTCFHQIQIDLCVHASPPLFLPTFYLPITLLISAWNVYRFTKPFAVAQLLEAILSSIGLLMSGSMWYMNLFFANYPQMPHRYVAFVFLLTYMLPRVWISELERSRITVEEVRPLLHDEVQFQNGNCVIRFNDEDEEDEITLPTSEPTNKSIIRTTELSPGQIFSSMLDKYDTKLRGCL